MKCSACGRKLRNQISREAGYGPVCYGRIFGRSIMAKAAKGGSKGKRESRVGRIGLPGQMEIEDYIGKEDMEKEGASATLQQTTIV